MARAWQRGAGAETAIELNIRQPIGQHLFIAPDLQYVIHPLGFFPRRVANAWVFLLRGGFRFHTRI
ncbi:carbohydrate porin [Acidithiobacillus sp. IBUN Pt1247-S3]|uniref:carbohydrate porin n=1 Tax=Acidithiobacillus sp. IBUN Pt1247-S3 TaxID=3166642 RepID=UPI0034E61160